MSSAYLLVSTPTWMKRLTRSTIEGGRGCNKFVPVLRGNGTKKAPSGYIFDQPPGGMSRIRGKLADHVGGHVVLSPEDGVLVTSPGTESSYPRLPQSLNNSVIKSLSRSLEHPPRGDHRFLLVSTFNFPLGS